MVLWKKLGPLCAHGTCHRYGRRVCLPAAVTITCRVNGELRQQDNTKNLVHSIAYIISELSHGMTLRCGTIISTGTPAGTGVGMNPPQYLKRGDVVECEIEGIGVLRNTVK